MSIRPCCDCQRYGTCEDPRKCDDGTIVKECDLYLDKSTGLQRCDQCAKKYTNGGTCRGTKQFAQYCGSYEKVSLTKHSSAPTERLEVLFEAQAKLNKRVGFDAADYREGLRPDKPAQQRLIYAGKWLNDYITAMQCELQELRDCTFWKHWYKEAREGRRFEIHNLEHARVEVVDLLFFWISLAQSLGMSPTDVFELYFKKLKANHKRQEDDCTTQEAKGYDI